jgi:DNA-binding beta-propeller fold protein YncE
MTVNLPAQLSSAVVLNSSSDVTIYLTINSRRRILAQTTIELKLKDIVIDPSGKFIYVKSSNPGVIDITHATIQVVFGAGLLITADGIPFSSTTSTISLNNPKFIASYYKVYQNSLAPQATGIITFIISVFLILSSTWNK